MRPIRKLAAILSADAVGYSRLMAHDEAATLAALNESRRVFRECIDAHGGRVIDTAGDSVLGEFPSPVEAVICAIEVQHALAQRNAAIPESRRMPYRIGVNLGDVVEESGALYGDAVNVASRLQALAQTGGICISGTVFDQVEGKLSIQIEFLGEQQVKNIPKPIRVYALMSESDSPSTVATLAMPTGPTLAVLPFTNMSGDPKEDYFSDGLTEDIITELSRFRELHVLARNTTFQYKGQAIDVAAVGRKLSAGYILEGSVRKSTDRVRITAQLIDVKTGTHLWAERYDRELTEIFALQDEIMSRIVGAVASGSGSVIHRVIRDLSSRKGANQLGAYELVLRAMAPVFLSPEDYRRKKALLEEAVRLDPGYARARQELAWVLLRGWVFRNETTATPPEQIKQNAIKAVELDPFDALAHRTAAFGYYLDGQFSLFEHEARLAFDLAPYSAEIFAQLGTLMMFNGQFERGVGLLDKARKLNEASSAGWYHSGMFYYLYNHGDYLRAIEVIAQHPNQVLCETLYKYVAAYGQLGKVEKAREYWAKCVAAVPQFSVEWTRAMLTTWNFPPAAKAALLDGVEKAQRLMRLASD